MVVERCDSLREIEKRGEGLSSNISGRPPPASEIAGERLTTDRMVLGDLTVLDDLTVLGDLTVLCDLTVLGDVTVLGGAV